MRKKVLGTILTVVMTLSLLLVGCGGEEIESQEGAGQNNEVQQEQNENLVQGDLFSGTIFDELVMGETTTTEVEALLEERILEYEYEYVENAFSSLAGVTTITDEFYEYDALYRYILLGGGKKADYILTEWTVELLLNEDSEYKDVVKRIQDVIDENALTEYTPLENSYSDSLVKGSVIYYPIKKFVMNDKDVIQYIMFGKFANCDSEDAKHIVVMSVGIITEANYQTGEIVKHPTFTFEPIEINPEILQTTEPTEMENYQNIAFYIADTNNYDNARKRIVSIISINEETKEMKLVNVNSMTYFNVGKDVYKRCDYARNIAQNISALNNNLDMDIEDFIALDFQGLSNIVDTMGGVWIDVQGINEADNLTMNQEMTEVTNLVDLPVLENGYQLLNGKQFITYLYYMNRKHESEAVCQAFEVIHEQMQSADGAILEQVLNICHSQAYTSFDKEELEGIKDITDYSYTETGIFPQEDMREGLFMSSSGSCFVPTDLESNVIWLHKFLFNQDNYEVSDTVKEYSEQIEENAEEYRTE